MIDEETWNIRTDRDKMETLIKYNMTVQYHKKCFFFKRKKASSNVKQSFVSFSMNGSFLTLWRDTPRPNWETHMDWKNDVRKIIK